MPTKKVKRFAAKVPAKKGGGANMKAMKVGAGVAAGVAAALAGAYLLYHKSAAPQRKQAKAWVLKAKKEAAREMKKLKQVSAAEYGRIIDKAMQRYGSVKEVNAAELMAAAGDLKAEWKHIQAEAAKTARNPKRVHSKGKAVPKRRVK